MNRLWVRLSLAFSGVVLIGVLTIIASSVLLSRAVALDTPLVDYLKAPGGVVDQLADYYQAHHGWQGVDVFLAGVESLLPSGTRLTFSLQATGSQTQYSARLRSDTQPLESVPIMANGEILGTLHIARITGELPVNQRAYFLERLRDFLLLVAATGGIVGILFGVLVSRSLTAPLERLAAAAQAIGHRDLHHRVTITGSREIVAVSRAFNEMASGLEQAETLRRNLVADVAHELRTPLSVLQGNLLAILDKVYPLDAEEIARLYSQTHLLSRLVNDLHELSLAESRQLHLNRQLTDIPQLLRSVIAAFGPTAEASSVRLELYTADDLPQVTLDPLRLTQVLDNLLGNAVRHTPSGGMISLSAMVSHAHLQIVVKDTGDGIAPEHLPHVFDRFYRMNRGRSRATGGTGLGLAIARAIVEMHGGQVAAVSDGVPGHGTAFTVQIPLDQPSLSPTNIVDKIAVPSRTQDMVRDSAASPH